MTDDAAGSPWAPPPGPPAPGSAPAPAGPTPPSGAPPAPGPATPPYGWGHPAPPPAGYGAPPGPYPPGPYPPAQYPPGYGHPPPRYAPGTGPTNGLAIASLVCGILWIYWVGSVLAVVFGFVAKRQIRERGEGGNGLATAGIVLGFIGIGVFALFMVFAVLVAVSGGSSF